MVLIRSRYATKSVPARKSHTHSRPVLKQYFVTLVIPKQCSCQQISFPSVSSQWLHYVSSYVPCYEPPARGPTSRTFRTIGYYSFKGIPHRCRKSEQKSSFFVQDCDATFMLCQMPVTLFSRRIWTPRRFLIMLASGFLKKH